MRDLPPTTAHVRSVRAVSALATPAAYHRRRQPDTLTHFTFSENHRLRETCNSWGFLQFSIDDEKNATV
jgi:hypothetical protein